MAAAGFLCIALAWQVIATGITRSLMQQGDLSAAIAHDPRASSALSAAASVSLDDGNLVQAHRYALAALAAAPLDQRALTVAALTSKPEYAIALMNRSAALGWRDRLTQLWLARASTQSGDATGFAVRFDAIARQFRDPEQISALLDDQISNPAIQTAIVERMLLRPAWRSDYLAHITSNDRAAIDNRYTLIAALKKTGAPLDRKEMIGVVGALNSIQLVDDARRFWRDFVAKPQHVSGLVYDGNFAEPIDAADRFAFEWNATDVSGGYAAIEEEDGSHALHLHTDGLSNEALIRQMPPLTPGQYILTMRNSAHGDPAMPDGASGFVWSLRCFDGQLMVTAAPLTPGKMQSAFAVASTCRSPSFAISATTLGRSTPRDLWVESVRIDPAR